MIQRSIISWLFLFAVSLMLFAQESNGQQTPEGFVLAKAGSFQMGSESTSEAEKRVRALPSPEVMRWKRLDSVHLIQEAKAR